MLRNLPTTFLSLIWTITVVGCASETTTSAVCELNEFRCAGALLQGCLADGQWAEPISCGGSGTCVVDPTSGEAECQVSLCGNGELDEGEACDDGNRLDGDECSSDCSRSACGDGVCIQGETPTNCAIDCGGTCVPDTARCTEGKLERCGRDREWEAPLDCLNGQICVEDVTAMRAGCESQPRCGDGLVQAGESCDDGNTTTELCAYGEAACMVCDASCRLVPGITQECGDGTQQETEACDDGNTEIELCAYGEQSCMVCDASCQLVAGETQLCGDGIQQAEETCDDSNTELEVCAYGEAACMVCDASCQLVAGETQLCGDGVQQASEACDDGNTVIELCAYGEASCMVCDGSCQLIVGETQVCGDGVQQASETCDDGNTTTELCAYGEASCMVCDTTCQLVAGETQTCGDGIQQASEGCDDNNVLTESCAYGQMSCEVCDASCTLVDGAASYCGDGVIQAETPEECDEGPEPNQACVYGEQACTVCDDACQNVAGIATYCGDGELQADAGESCDEGMANDDTSGCLSNCVVASCGDGFVRTDIVDRADANFESCDDGNETADDGCHTDCQPAENQEVLPAVACDAGTPCVDGAVSYRCALNECVYENQFAFYDTASGRAANLHGALQSDEMQRDVDHFLIENRCGQLAIDEMNRGQNCPAELVSVYRFQLDYQTPTNQETIMVQPDCDADTCGDSIAQYCDDAAHSAAEDCLGIEAGMSRAFWCASATTVDLHRFALQTTAMEAVSYQVRVVQTIGESDCP